MKATAKKKTRSNKLLSKKVSKRSPKHAAARDKKVQRKPAPKSADKGPLSHNVSLPAPLSPAPANDDSRVFTIEIDSIRAETTIGDLIVAFPKTRDVLMKHGLRFDVEQAGYLYMTLNVFSAIHGLVLTGLLQELDVASKEMPLPPLAPPLRQIAPPPAA
jgi:hypothetical protein